MYLQEARLDVFAHRMRFSSRPFRTPDIAHAQYIII